MFRAMEEMPSQKPNSTEEATLIEALFFKPSKLKFAWLKSAFISRIARTADQDILEVKLSITKKGDGRSGAVVKMRWGADTLNF